MSLSLNDFKNLCKISHLTAIDLIIYYNNSVLCGLRKNAPAKNTYFVPGGRIQKMELMNDAIQRIAIFELGITLDVNRINKLGTYEHIYVDSFVDDNISTHYIVFPISYTLTDFEYSTIIECIKVFNIQHLCTIWQNIDTILDNPDIHQYTKYYFINNPPNKFI